ncbi:MAG: GAF domain-containing protein, partial [Actinomycetota bacterium]|nr:GAF domain-containing protein [Actinomycetota bacterium]
MSERSPLRRAAGYLIALGGPLAATALARALAPRDLLVPALLYIAAIVPATVFGRLGAGVLASVISFGGLIYSFTEPVNRFGIDLSPEHLLALALFLAVAIAVAVVIDRMEGAIHRRNESLHLLDEALGQREQALRELRVSRDQLAVTLTGVADGIVVQEPSGKLVYANEAAAAMLDADRPDALLQRDPQDITSGFEVLDESGMPFEVERFPGRLALEGQHPPSVVIRLRDPETRKERWSVVTATPIVDDDGNVRQAVTIFRDITDERHEENRRRVLAEATEELASSLDYEGTVTALAELAVRRLADICVIYLMEDGAPRRVEVAHTDPQRRELLRELSARIPLEDHPEHPAIRVMRTGEPIMMPRIPDQVLAELIEDPEELRAVRDLGLKSSLIVPLASPDRVLGAMSLATADSGRVFGEDDLEVASELGRRAGTAIENVGLHVGEQRARRSAEAAARRIARLQSVTAALSERLTMDEVAEVVVGQGIDALGAAAGCLVLLEDDGTHLRVRRSEGYPDEVLEGWSRFPVDGAVPLSEAFRTGQPTLAEAPGRALLGWDLRQAPEGTPQEEAWVALPLMVKGEAIGAIGFSFKDSTAFGEDDRSFVIALAQQSSQALERALLYETEREARAQAQAARERLSFLAEASEALSASLDQQEILDKLADLAIPRLADWCIVDVGVGTEVQQVAVNHVDPEKVELVRELRQKHPPDWEQHPVARVLRTGNPELASEVRGPHHDPGAERLLRELGNDSYMVVPLLARWRVLGAVSFIAGASGRRYTAADLALAEDLARRAALALDNARLYEEQSHAAHSLQKSLLPASLPEIPGMEVEARYRAAGESNEVGGDFYDVFEIAPDRWAMVIGDVCGKGPDAAALTGLARHTIRTAALHHDRPERVLRVLNAAILKEDPLRFCTASYAVVGRSDGGAEVSVVCGGHPPPLVLRADGTV